MSLLIPRIESAAHWYDRQGNPRHDADLRVARKDGLLPAPSTLFKSMVNKGLEFWREDQIIISAVTLPRLPGEDTDQFCQRVLIDAASQAEKAKAFGTNLHLAMEEIVAAFPKQPTWTRIPKETIPFANYLFTWFQMNVAEVVWVEQVLVNLSVGYAGRGDVKVILRDGRSCLPDLKSQDCKMTKTKVPRLAPAYYESWPMQLACYNRCPGAQADCTMSIVMDSKTPTPPFVKEWTLEEEEESWQDFLALLAWWKRLKRYEPVRNGSEVVAA